MSEPLTPTEIDQAVDSITADRMIATIPGDGAL